MVHRPHGRLQVGGGLLPAPSQHCECLFRGSSSSWSIHALAGMMWTLEAHRIHSCATAQVGVLSFTPRQPPNGNRGQGQSVLPLPSACPCSPALPYWPCQLVQDSPGAGAACLICATLPQAAKPRGASAITASMGCSQRVRQAGLQGGLAVQTAGTPASSYPSSPNPRGRRVSVAVGPGRAAPQGLCPHCPGITVCFSFQPNHFFFLFF